MSLTKLSRSSICFFFEKSDEKFSKALAEIGKKINGGIHISEAMNESGIFTNEEIEYIRIGETCGNLDGMIAIIMRRNQVT